MQKRKLLANKEFRFVPLGLSWCFYTNKENIMKKTSSKFNIKLRVLVEYVWVIFLILNGNSVYHAAANTDYHFPVVCTILSVLLLLITPPVKKIGKKSSFVAAIFLLCYFGAYFILQQSVVSKEIYLFGFVVSIPVLLLYHVKLHQVDEPARLFYRIETVVLFLAVTSLFLWLLGPILNVIQPNCSITINWGNKHVVHGYFGLQYLTQRDTTFIYGLIRNTSIFCEGPMFNLWLSIALMTEFFLRPKVSKRKVVLLCITILTTTTTTGIFVIVMCMVFSWLQKVSNTKSKAKLILIWLMCTILPIIALTLWEIFVLKMDTKSYSIRFQDYIIGMKLWAQKPLLGYGYGNLGAIFAVKEGSKKGFSNSITAILATGGLWHFLVYLLSIFGPMRRQTGNKGKYTSFMIVYAVLTIVTIFFARYIFVVFVSFGLSFFMFQKQRSIK